MWVWLRRVWPGWHRALVLVQPATVVRWHRNGFRTYWRWKSRPKGGRPRIDPQVQKLIREMWVSNPTWGKPRIQAELHKIGIEVSDSTVQRYRPPRPSPPSQTWRSFLENHVRDIVAIDFFVVPTATFRVLYVFLVMSHDRRRILHFNVTTSPSAQWTAQQLLEAFPYEAAPRFLLHDRDSIFGQSFVRRVESMGVREVVTAPGSPWQNPYCERLIGSIRRECLDHVIVLSERHLMRVLRSYASYYHSSRTHRSLDNDCPDPRIAQGRIPPVVAAFVEQVDRSRELSANPDFTRFLADDLVPALRDRFGAGFDREATTVAGSSLGGLAAAYAALTRSDVFGAVLAQSGAFWWTPQDSPEPGWLMRAYAASLRLPLRFYLEVGRLEKEPVRGGPTMLTLTRHMRDVLCAKGYPVWYRETGGDHAYVTWRHSLEGGLEAILLPSGHPSTNQVLRACEGVLP